MMKIKIFKINKHQLINKESIIYINNCDEEIFKNKYFSSCNDNKETLFKVYNDFDYLLSLKKDYYIGYIEKSDNKIEIVISEIYHYNDDILIRFEERRLKQALAFYKKYKCYNLTFVRIMYNFYKLLLFPVLYIYNPFKCIYDEGVKKKDVRKIKGRILIICNHVGYLDGFNFIRRYFPETPFSVTHKDYYDNISKFAAHYSHLANILSLKDRNAIPDLISCIYANKPMGLFPEGEVRDINKRIEIEEGAAYFAIKGHVNLYPSITLNNYKAFRRQYVIFGKPIDASKYFKNDYKVDKEDLAQLTKIIEDEMNRLLTVGKERISKKRGKR